jgi:glyoxylase I family protein
MLNTRYEKRRPPADPDPKRGLGHHDVGVFPGCRNLDGAFPRLPSLGVEVKPPVVRDDRMKQVWLRDPDG